tara:strand:+ start:275 stop:655 length:381 start_codon:yes stop_codon:yes gene_type:complete
MGTKTLTTQLDISSPTINGIFTLNTTTDQTFSFDDTAVVTSTAEAVTGAGGTQLIAAGTAKIQYVYIKNIEAPGGNFATLETDGNEDWGRLEAGNWAFFPVAPSVGLQVKGDTGSVTIEYAIFQAP